MILWIIIYVIVSLALIASILGTCWCWSWRLAVLENRLLRQVMPMTPTTPLHCVVLIDESGRNMQWPITYKDLNVKSVPVSLNAAA
jgi:hypothetical protein